MEFPIAQGQLQEFIGNNIMGRSKFIARVLQPPGTLQRGNKWLFLKLSG
jgi:hypothetical protein